ncbi:small GTP-binding protein [Histomonas meleagridis]|uniref:small GTP-binding protein n=1 Tax=Histomonas meleagridis TaxID=135588 RepID=UPI003559E825|nr:small GTP-binding protein [Histomonas meleagridis]KAH0798124.1 small GTP-binding protein [Histomonas meleagridis]
MIDGTEVKLKIWDTAGQERFRALTPMYYRDCHVAILVFSVDSQQSLNELQNWYNDIKADSHVMPSIIVVGNKIDLPRAVSTQVGEQFAESISATYMECSAIEDKGIYDIFVEAGTLSLNKNLPQNQEKITRDITGDQTQKKCC